MKFLHRLLQRRDKPFITPADFDGPWLCEADDQLEYVRRCLVVLRPREPCVLWVRKNDPQGYHDYTLAEARAEDACAFMLPSGNGTRQETKGLVEQHWRHFFAQMLQSFEYDRQRWPPNRTVTMFRHWFDIELCQAIIDLGAWAD